MDTKEKRRTDRIRAQTRQKMEADVIYTQPKPFIRSRFLLRLATVVAVVLALLFGMSIFFKVDEDKIAVSGTGKYDPWTVREASGILAGENLLTLNKGRISSNILSKLPYVDKVYVEVQLPDSVRIHITELNVVYAIEDVDGNWWLMSAAGKITEKCSPAVAQNHTKITGVRLVSPSVGSAAVAYEAEPEEDENGQTVPVVIYGREQLETALSIIEQMEKNGFIGTVTSVDVSKMGDLQMWYGNRFQMLLGDATQLDKKINHLAQAVRQMDQYDEGVLDATYSYPNIEDPVIYTPFS